MDKINWIQIGIGLISGGAFGALIKQFFDNRRNRIQPVGYLLEVKPFFDSNDAKLIDSKITLTEGDNEFRFSKLYTGSLKIVNTGLLDYNEFDFGITCPETLKLIHLKATTDDRFHTATLSNKPSLQNHLSSVDFKLTPFNRKDAYSFDFLISCEVSIDFGEAIKMGSPKPIKWVKLTSTTDTIIEFANRTFLEIIASSISNVIRIR